MPYDRSRPGLLLHLVLDDGGLSAVRVGTEVRYVESIDSSTRESTRFGVDAGRPARLGSAGRT